MRYKTNKPKTDPTYSPEWSGVTGAPKAKGKACAKCGGPVHKESDSYYCPACDDYVKTVEK